MAISPAATYPSQVDTTDPTGYPYGKAKNVSVINDGTGTPLEEKWVSDVFGAQQALLLEAGLSPSGTPDRVGASQYLTAIKTVADARAKSALQSAQAMNFPERAAFGSVAANNSDLAICWAPNLGSAARPLWVVLDSAKTIFVSPDGQQGWNSPATLTNGSAAKPEMAFGQLDGVPAIIANGVGTHWFSSIDGSAFIDHTGGPAASGLVPCYSSSLNRWVWAGTSIFYCSATTAGFATFTTATVPSTWTSGSGGAKRVVWNGSLFVILPAGNYNKCLTSPDGISWTERTLPMTATWAGLAYSATDGIWMAASNSTGPMVVSADGFTWTTAASVGMYLGNDLAVLGSLWVMPTLIANGGGIIYSVDKGASWNKVAVGNHRVATNGWNRILAADFRFLVAHVDSTIGVEIALSQRAL